MSTRSTPAHPATPLLGAYAMAPADPDQEADLYARLPELGVPGLELPVLPPEAAQADPAWARRTLRPGWTYLLTCIPTAMHRLATAPGYGLASTDEDGRRAAVADVERAAVLARRLLDDHGARRVVGIQVHSAPGPERGSADALRRSLEEVAGWDAAGADVLVEHCDTLVPGQPAAKGFLTLEQELSAVRDVGAPHLGTSVNWGRSAIEGRSAGTALRHVEAAVAAGLLRALVLSGATDADGPWGPAWADTHIPPRGDDGALEASSASLLGPDEVRAAVGAAGPDATVAVKIAVRPTDADVATRLAVAQAALGMVRAAS